MSRILLTLLSALLWLSAAAQQQGENIILDQAINGGQHTYIATQSIRMLPGFSYKPVAGDDFFKAKVLNNPDPVEPPTAGTIGGPGGLVGNDGVVGGAKGSFGVNEFGQATYAFPLEFPGGRGGMTPELSLVYNSSGGDGILGPGWSLGGLSVISVTHGSRYYDGPADESIGLDYKKDTYTLDGQRLIPIADENSYMEFRTENDGFKRIRRYPSIKSGSKNPRDEYNYYFKVQTKSGLNYYYGEDQTNSKLQVNIGSSGTKVTVSYYVNKIEDNFGNAIHFEYENQTGDANVAAQIYIKKITYTYTFNDNTADYSIDFLYRDRNAPKQSYYIYQNSGHSYESVLLFESSKLIDSVVCMHNDTRSIVKTYDLEYQYRGHGSSQEDKAAYLFAIQEKGKENKIAYNKTIFELEPEMDYGFLESENYLIPKTPQINPDENSIMYSFIDFDNDGSNELVRTGYKVDNNILDISVEVFRKNNDQYLLDKWYIYRQDNYYLLSAPYYSFNDVNGDGFPDFFVGFYGSNGNHGSFFYLVLNNNGNLSPDGDNWLSNNAEYIVSFNDTRLPFLADFNGDAITDLMIKPTNDSQELFWRLGAADYPLSTNIDNGRIFNPQSEDIVASNDIKIADYNGDGRADILRNESMIHYIIKNQDNNMKFTNYPDYIALENFVYCRINSDNKLDAIKASNTYVDYDPDDPYTNIVAWSSLSSSLGSGTHKFEEFGNYEVKFDVPYPTNVPQHNYFDVLGHPGSIMPIELTGDGANEFLIDYRFDFRFYELPHNIPINNLNLKDYLVGIDSSFVSMLLFLDSEGASYLFEQIDYRKNWQAAFINSDNQTELFSVDNDHSSTHSQIVIRYPEYNSNRINSITNSLGASTEIEYDFTANPEVYTPGFAADYPVVPYNSSMPVVKTVRRQNGVGGWHLEKYQYENAIAHAEGLGFMGFLKTVRTDHTLNRTYITEYDYDDTFYYTYPALQQTTHKDGTNILSKTQSFYHRVFDGLYNRKYYYVAPDESVTTYFNPAKATAYKVEKQKFELYDDYGNPGKITTSNGPSLNNMHFETVLEQSFENFTNSKKWMLSRLRTAKTTKKTLNQQPEPALVMSSGFQYYGGGDASPKEGMLYKEILHDYDQNNPNHLYKTTKTYTYDDFGNITTTLLTANNDQRITANNRLTTTTYTEDGRFVKTLVNPMLHNTSRLYDEVLGTLQSETDVDNELTTFFEYDAFGRLQKSIAPDQNQQASVLRWVEKGDPDAPDNNYAVYYSWQRSSGQTPVKVYYSSTGLELRTVTVNFDGATVYVDQLYDNQGRLSKKSEPYIKGSTAFYTTLQYDKFNRIQKQFAPDGGITTIIYDGLTTTTERKVSANNGQIQKSVKVLNTAGWVSYTEDHYGTRVSNTYTSNGRVHTKKIAGKDATARYFEYDINGNLISYMDSNQDNPVTYSYNAFNELISETNAKNQTTSYDSYDALSRLLQKTYPNGQLTTYSYDTKKTGLPDWTEGPGHKVEYTYDELLRVENITETINNQSYTTSHTYDELGRLSNLVYPGGYTITHHYNINGYQNKITEAATGKLLWEGTTANARNQFTQQRIGPAHEQQIDYYAETGLVENMISGGLQDNHYSWDLLGNLTYRTTLHGKAESFEYDYLNRLEYVYHNGSQALLMTYGQLGNITYKSDVGTYEYLTNKPYQLDNINNKPLQIGNETQDVQYNHFNKVIQITETNDNGQLVRQMNLQYGIDHQRIRQNIWTQDGLETEKIYVGGIYELETINRETTALHYIYGPSGLVAIKKQEMEGNTTSLQFVLNDHLGSIQLLTDEQGNLIEEYSYDAWGMRRDPYTFEPILSGSSQIAYGFTGHEQLDLFKLVNMNGRMYDPVIGRFMSPDPVLQFPNFTQGLNPYSYVLNNPLRYTDPSGYSLVGQLAAIAASIAFSGGNPVAAAAIYASVMTVDYVIERKFKINIGQIFEYYTQTFVVTTIQAGGSQVIGGIIGRVGKLGRELMRATAHGAFNGTMRMAQGGKFEHGFLSGFVSSLGGSVMQSYGTSMSTMDKIVLSSVIGGTAEALGGGKFSNGAVTGAFVMAYNHLQEEKAKNAHLTASEYEGLSEDKKEKYIEQPLEAVVMEEERTMVSTITPSGSVTVKTQTTTEIWGATAWVKKRYLLRNTTYSIMIDWITGIKTTQIFYHQYSYSNNWFLSNLSWIGNVLYPTKEEKVIPYRNKSEYPGGFLDDYLNFLR